MDGDAVLLCVRAEPLQVCVEVAQRVFLDGARRLAQLFPFGQACCHAVALGAERPERGVVPRDVVCIGKESPCRL